MDIMFITAFFTILGAFFGKQVDFFWVGSFLGFVLAAIVLILRYGSKHNSSYLELKKKTQIN